MNTDLNNKKKETNTRAMRVAGEECSMVENIMVWYFSLLEFGLFFCKFSVFAAFSSYSNHISCVFQF